MRHYRCLHWIVIAGFPAETCPDMEPRWQGSPPGKVQVVSIPVSYTHLDVYKRQLADSSRESANNIQEISNRVVESVEELSENATRLLEFMNTRVMKDYDALEDTGSNYHEAADHVDEMMNEFGQKIDELLSVLQNVNTANTQMEATVGDSTEKLSVVEKNNQGLQQEMKDISYAVEELAASAGQLKESIRCFTVV